MRIAIVGTGVAGLVSAHLLHPDHDITVFESDARVGGHANTVDVEVDGRRHAVDTGFIVYNERNYPGFVALLRELGVVTQATDMSFGVSDSRSGLEFRASNLELAVRAAPQCRQPVVSPAAHRDRPVQSGGALARQG